MVDEDFDSEEDFGDDELIDDVTDLDILKTFFDDEESLVYVLLGDGSYKTIQCQGKNEAKTLYLAITNR